MRPSEATCQLLIGAGSGLVLATIVYAVFGPPGVVAGWFVAAAVTTVLAFSELWEPP